MEKNGAKPSKQKMNGRTWKNARNRGAIAATVAAGRTLLNQQNALSSRGGTWPTQTDVNSTCQTQTHELCAHGFVQQHSSGAGRGGPAVTSTCPVFRSLGREWGASCRAGTDVPIWLWSLKRNWTVMSRAVFWLAACCRAIQDSKQPQKNKTLFNSYKWLLRGNCFFQLWLMANEPVISKCTYNNSFKHRRSQGGAHPPIFRISSHSVLWEVVSQRKYCC